MKERNQGKRMKGKRDRLLREVADRKKKDEELDSESNFTSKKIKIKIKVMF